MGPKSILHAVALSRKATLTREEMGKITGSLIGAIVYMSLMNGMNLMQTDSAIQYVIRGAVLAAAVIFDVTTRKAKK